MLICNVADSQTGWFQQNSGTSHGLESVFFLNDQTGFACGGFRIYKTTNGGTSWTERILSDTTTLTSLRFLNNLTGYACGGRPINNYISYQHLFKTTNAGETWIKIVQSSGTMTTEYFYDVFPIDNFLFLTRGGSGAMGSTSGMLWVSTNGGVNFNFFNGIYGESIYKTYFINTLTGWVTTLYGTDVPYSKRRILKTTNSGQNWAMQFRDSSTNSFSSSNFEIQFVNQNTGFGLYYKDTYSNDNATFLKSTNGGTNWDSTTLPYNKSKALYFADGNMGWIAGGWYPDSIMILRTTNGGNEWQIQKKGVNSITAMYFVNNLTGWAVGYNGVILKTVTGGLTGVQNISSEVPSAFSLSQNYPNPFNPVTKIRFDIQKPEFRSQNSEVTLNIFDITGKEVATLVNERLQAGTYETTFDGSELNSGVYFYRLTAEGFSETKRMLLIK